MKFRSKFLSIFTESFEWNLIFTPKKSYFHQKTPSENSLESSKNLIEDWKKYVLLIV